MKNETANRKMNSFTRLLGTIALGGGVLAASIVGSNAQAACEPVDGKSIAGTYIPTSSLDNARSTGGTVLVTLKQTGCDLEVKTSIISQYLQYMTNGKFQPKTNVTNGGVWKFDLRGEKKATIPKEYIQANSNDPRSTVMTKSLEVYTKLQDDGQIHFTVLFDFEHAGATVRMSAEADLNFYTGNTLYSNNPKTFTGQMHLAYPGFKFRVIPSAELAERTGARNLVIANGVNWLLEALQPQINDVLHASSFYFMRK